MSRSWRVLAAMAMAGLGAFALCGSGAMLALVPVSLFGGTVPGGPRIMLVAISVVVLAAAVRLVMRTAPTATSSPRRPPEPGGPDANGARLGVGVRGLGRAHLWVGLVALLLIVGFVLPATDASSEPDHIADLFDLFGLLAGLGLLAAAAEAPPPPGALARVIALSGGLASAYVLLSGARSEGRLVGFGLNPNYLGAFLALPFTAGIGLAVRGRRPAWALPAAVCLAGMVATQSRGALVAAVTGVAILLIQGHRFRVQALIAGGAAMAAAVFPVAIDAVEHAVVGGRQAADLSHNTAIREQVVWFATRVAAGHPFRGIGYGLFPSYAETHFGLRIATHNDYLRLAAETGLLTLAGFLAVLWLGLRRPAPGDLAFPRAVAGAYAVGLLFANTLSNLMVSTPFWLSLGCLLAASKPDLLRSGSAP
jgi:hypothetical protein